MGSKRSVRYGTCMKCGVGLGSSNKTGVCGPHFHWWRRNFDPEFKAEARRRSREWREKNPEHKARLSARSHIKVKYGVSADFIDELRAKSGGACAICKRTDRKLAIDHDHITGRVRGLLCNYCNTGLGWYERNNPSAVADYLAAARAYSSI